MAITAKCIKSILSTVTFPCVSTACLLLHLRDLAQAQTGEAGDLAKVAVVSGGRLGCPKLGSVQLHLSLTELSESWARAIPIQAFISCIYV